MLPREKFLYFLSNILKENQGIFSIFSKNGRGDLALPPLVAPLRLKKELAINFYGK